MPIDFKAKRERVTAVTVDFDGDPLTIEVYAKRVSMADIEDAQGAVDSGDQMAMIKFLLSCLKSLDATVDGQPIPIEYEFLRRELPVEALTLIVQTVGDAIAGDKASEKKS